MLKYFALTAVLLQIQIGSVYANTSDINKELKDEQSYQLNFQKLKQGKPSSQAKVYYSQAKNKYQNKDYEGAILDLTQAIKIDPNYADAYGFRGMSRSKLGDEQGAILDFNQAANFFLQQGNMKNYLEVLENIKRIQGR